MCQRLNELTSAMRAYSSRFSASLLSCADAAIVVKQAAAIEHMAAAVKALAAARAAEAQSWKAGGYRSPEEHLAQTTGSTVSGARDALTLGRRLASQPEVAAAAQNGTLSPTQASVIADAVAVDANAAGTLLDAASSGGSVADLKDQCAATKAAAMDMERRRAEIRHRRFLRAWTDQDGKWHLIAAGTPEDGAQVMAALIPRANEVFEAARLRGERENPDAYRFDALVQLAKDATSEPVLRPPDLRSTTHEGGDLKSTGREVDDSFDLFSEGEPERRSASERGTGNPEAQATDATPFATASNHRGRRKVRRRPRQGAPVKLLLRVDLEAFLRGFPVDGETCDLVGYGPVSMSAVHEILEHGDPFVVAILTKGKHLAGVAHLGRRPNAYQRSCLEWLYPTCAVQGCAAAARLEMDHRDDWARTHITVLDLLDALCPHHHRLKTRDGWALVDGVGKRAFVAPDDPRHPRNGGQPSPTHPSGPFPSQPLGTV